MSWETIVSQSINSTNMDTYKIRSESHGLIVRNETAREITWQQLSMGDDNSSILVVMVMLEFYLSSIEVNSLVLFVFNS